MSNLSKYIIFKPVPGGYVYRIPNAWVFGSGVHLLVDERQKAAIIRTMDSVPLFPIIAAWWVALSIVFGTVALWAARSLPHNVRDVLIATSVLLSIYGALFISRRVLLSRLRPVLAGLPKTDERITSADIRGSTPPAVLSPTRLRILKVCLGLMPLILVSLLISRAVDMHQETHEPMLESLLLANTDLGGWIILLGVAACLYFGVAACLYYGLLFIRRKRPGPKTP